MFNKIPFANNFPYFGDTFAKIRAVLLFKELFTEETLLQNSYILYCIQNLGLVGQTQIKNVLIQ